MGTAINGNVKNLGAEAIAQQPGAADERTIRKRIREELPADTFRPQTWRVIWFLPLTAVIIGGITAMLTLGLPWWGNLLLAMAVGNSLVAQAFLAHEVLHGAAGMSRSIQNFFGWLGFGPMLITPEFWRAWHNREHHGNTNQGDKDPDSFGTMVRYKKHPQLTGFLKLAPGSGTWYSYFFLTYSFIFHAQLVLWFQTRKTSAFPGFDRKRAIRQAIACGVAWLALIALSGSMALFTVLIPLVWANMVGQGYILTNHFLRPQTETNNPVDNSMSVCTPAIVDRLHFRFSHHVEHHLFPNMASSKAPRVREWLQKNLPERYVAPSHVKAIRMLYKTPRVYLTPTTLVDPKDLSATYDLVPLQDELMSLNRDVGVA